MVQFNLLPDVKLEYIKAQRTKRLVMLAAFTATGLAVFVLVLLFLVVNVFQKQHLSNLNNDIKAKTEQLKSVEDLEKVLTIQNQLKSLTPLHESKPATSRLNDYLVQLTPNDAKISEVEIDFSQSSMTISGSAGALETINRFADILKFTDYKAGETSDKAFSEVVLESYGSAGGRADNGRSPYSFTFKFDPVIFDNTKTVQLVVPNIISTRSVIETPTDLFEPKPQVEVEQNQ